MTMRCHRILLCLAAAAAPTASAFDLMSAVLKSPIYKNLLVPASRNMMINTAKENGVPWADAVAWIRGATTWELDEDADVAVPAYYRQPFHAYEPGNLCWEAAWEAEVAGRAVGARNYPAFGADGEEDAGGEQRECRAAAAGARRPPQPRGGDDEQRVAERGERERQELRQASRRGKRAAGGSWLQRWLPPSWWPSEAPS